MDMANASTSLDQLDAMLASGSLSQTDYETLKSAMASRSAKRPEPETSTRPMLRKSWSNRQLGGVCAGLGEWMGVEPRLVRFGFFIALFVTGGSVLFFYLLLSFMLPWKESELDQVTRFSWRFAGCLLGLWLGLHAALIAIKPQWSLFKDFGRGLPAITLRAVDLADSLQTSTSVLIQILALATIACCYSMIPESSSLRRVVARTTCYGIVGVLLFVVTGLCAGLLQH